MLDERLQKIASITYNIDVDACIIPINKWPTADQDLADINPDIGNRSCSAGESSAILWEKCLAATLLHTPRWTSTGN